MKRDRATSLLQQLLSNVATTEEWPASLVQTMWIFGSYARGAMTPNDVDVAVDHDRTDLRWGKHFIHCLSYGRDPYSVLRQALVGRVRSVSLLFDRGEGHDDVPMTLLWRRGEPLEIAMARLHSIPVDPTASRAPRDAMLPCFDGLEHWVPRYLREELIALIDSRSIRVDQVQLVDADILDRWVRRSVDRRWAEGSPLRRAAYASLAHLEKSGVDLHAVHLHGQDIDKQATPHFVGFQLRYLRSALYCFEEHGGKQWLEVVHPTRRGPLLALRLQPLSQQVSAKRQRGASSFFS